jgi:hypothetical protein
VAQLASSYLLQVIVKECNEAWAPGCVGMCVGIALQWIGFKDWQH